jgi:hypothetical protein
MSELGNLLELLATGETPFETLRASFRFWSDPSAAHTAQLAYARKTKGSFGLLGEDVSHAASEPLERMLLIWRTSDHARTDRYVGEKLVSRRVRFGSRWWAWSSVRGERHGIDSVDEVSAVGRELVAILDPVQLLHALVFEAVSSVVVAARPAVRADSRPRDGRMAGGRPLAADLHPIGIGADRYVLDFDRERGILLGVLAEYQGCPFRVLEAREIAFDETLPNKTFAFTRSIDSSHTHHGCASTEIE